MNRPSKLAGRLPKAPFSEAGTPAVGFDVHVTAEYRRNVAEVLTVRALNDAFRMADRR